MDEWPSTSLLGGMPVGARATLLALGGRRTYRHGQRLIREGARDTYVVVLCAGFVKVTGELDDGRDSLLAIRTRGDTVGELAALDDAPRSATVTACGPVEGRVVLQRDFLRFLRDHPDAAFAVNRMNAARLRWANQRRLDFHGFDASARISRAIAELIRAYGRPTARGLRCVVRVTQAELAALAATSRESVEKTVHELREEGIIDWRYATFTVVDRRRLHELARLFDRNP